MEEGEEENEELLAHVGIVDCEVVLQVETTDVFRQLKGGALKLKKPTKSTDLLLVLLSELASKLLCSSHQRV